MFKKLFGFLGKSLAMDLGTANTLLYTPKDGIVLNQPQWLLWMLEVIESWL